MALLILPLYPLVYVNAQVIHANLEHHNTVVHVVFVEHSVETVQAVHGILGIDGMKAYAHLDKISVQEADTKHAQQHVDG